MVDRDINPRGKFFKININRRKTTNKIQKEMYFCMHFPAILFFTGYITMERDTGCVRKMLAKYRPNTDFQMTCYIPMKIFFLLMLYTL